MFSSPKNETRMLLVGDRNVGKTSLIMSLVNEQFTQDVPARLDEIFIPGDVTRQNIPTCIVDYSSREQDSLTLEMEIRRADVIIIVYAVNNEASLDSIANKWIPLVEQNTHRRFDSGNSDKDRPGVKPVILAGNKVDLATVPLVGNIDGSAIEPLLSLDAARCIMDRFDVVETCVEVSALSLQNISELFYHAQKAVLYPSAPLYDYNQRCLRDRCRRALIRIFRICDCDNDNLLSDSELSTFQERCFFVDLTAQTLSRLKDIVRCNCPPDTCGIVGGRDVFPRNKTRLSPLAHNGNACDEEYLTLDGFLVLASLLIERGRHETVWTFLRRFGYDDDLGLDHNYFSPELKLQDATSCVELSQEGYDFLASLFERYDMDGDDALNPEEFKAVFETCPRQASASDPHQQGGKVGAKAPNAGIPFGREYQLAVQCDCHGWIDGTGFLALWTLAVHLEPRRVVQVLAYLGYPFWACEENALGALRVTRKRSMVGNVNSGFTTPTSKTGAKSGANVVGSSTRIMSTVRRTTHQINRTVYHCHVIGNRGAGKSTLCQAFVNPHSVQNRSICAADARAMTVAGSSAASSINGDFDDVDDDDRHHFPWLMGKQQRRPGSAGMVVGGAASIAAEKSDAATAAAVSAVVTGPTSVASVGGRPTHTINAVEVVKDGVMDVYLILQDIDVEHVRWMLTTSEVDCDVCCLVYDVSNAKSFEYCARIYLKYFAIDSPVPVLIIGNKADLPAVRQDYEWQPEAFCARHNLSPPVLIAASKVVSRDLFKRIATMALLPKHISQQTMPTEARPVRLSLWVFGVTMVAVLAVSGFAIGRHLQSR